MNIGASYNLEIDKIVKEVNKNDFKKVVLQFPDGLKYYSNKVVDVLNEKTKAKFFIYFGSCFGACDVPLHLKELNFDLCVQFGHNVYLKKKIFGRLIIFTYMIKKFFEITLIEMPFF